MSSSLRLLHILPHIIGSDINTNNAPHIIRSNIFANTVTYIFIPNIITDYISNNFRTFSESNNIESNWCTNNFTIC